VSSLIDTHCHLNLAESFSDPGAEVDAAEAAGVARCILIGIDLDSSRRAVELAEEDPRLFAVVGWHPNYAEQCTPSGLRAIRELLDHPKVVALGEIGLDYHWDYATPERQKEVLLQQLDIAAEHQVPVVFHCRKAYPDLLDILEARERLPYLFHCFSGDAEDARRAIALDGYFGVDGPITYKNAHQLREVVRSIPRNRLVVETDSPYLTPEPHRSKPNRPAYVTLVNAGLAACLGIDEKECAEMTTRNAEAFFSL
jgi:TatD DNase family protein